MQTEKEAIKRETMGDSLPSPRKFTVKGLAKASADLKKLLKKLENEINPRTYMHSPWTQRTVW